MNHPPIGGLSNLGPKDASGNRTYAMAEKLALGATAALAAWTAYAALTRKKAVVVRPSKTGPGFNEGVVAGRYLVSMQDHEGMAAVPGKSYEVAIRPLKGTDVESPYLLPFFKPSDVGLSAKYDPYWSGNDVGSNIPTDLAKQLVADLRDLENGTLKMPEPPVEIARGSDRH